MLNRNKRGMILFLVIGIIMVAAILSAIILRVVSHHARLTHHQVSRIQAYYAAKAGIVYALDKLASGTWTYSPVNSCPDGSTSCEVSDSSFPSTIPGKKFTIVFCPSGSRCASVDYQLCSPPSGNNFCINSTVDFTYTP